MAGARSVSDAFSATDAPSSTPQPSIRLQNQLASSSSPYLRAHKDNLVAWQEWSPNTISLAQAHERPIFLSIGYSACHWCHVMAHESFESSEIASLLNESFVPIKVDRESRPDLDDIYMHYVTATTGSGGWPLNVFLTPDLQPLFGGTYWPSPHSERARNNTTTDSSEDRPMNFLDIVQKIQDIWQNERQKCIASAADITHQLQAFAAEGIHGTNTIQIRGNDVENDPPEPLDLDLLDDALDHFVSRYDSRYGGFISGAGSAGPKFATPANLTFLLRIGASITRPSTHTRFGFPSPVPGILGTKSCATAARMALHTLQSISRSAMRDQLGNGFHRYSVTPDWNLPHFEKMLYDNAQLLGVYCDAWALGRDAEVLGTIYDLAEYLTNPESPIVRASGGWYSSEDADSRPSLVGTTGTSNEKKEGALYVWTMKELQTLLGDREGSVVARHFGVKEHGNIPRELDVNDEFVNQNVLHVDATPSVLAKEFGLKEDEVVRIIKEGKKKLLDFRKANRAAPDVDDKVILSYNALAISALARAANTLTSIDENRAKVARDAAVQGTEFVRANMFNPATGRLTRIYSDQVSAASDTNKDLAFVDDYAFLIHALRTLFDLTFEQHYLDWALQLQATLDRDFSAGRRSGYHQAATTRPAQPTEDSVSKNTSLPQTVESIPPKAQIPEQILNLKPGTDNALPSANGVIAGNLLYLSSYTSALSTTSASPSASVPRSSTSTSLQSTSRNTIDAFAPEIIQHPFLYVSLLSAIVMDTVGVKSLLVPLDMSETEIEARGLRGFGRTVVRAPGLKTGEVVVCETDSSGGGSGGGHCRPLRDGELDPSDDEDEIDAGDDGKALQPEVSAEVIELREEMARKESLALELEQKGVPLV